jgi:flavin-dependent dehydrogenase
VPVFDSVVIGGGTACSTAAWLLAQWSQSVAVLTAPFGTSSAECLLLRTRKLFVFLGVQDAIDPSRFFPATYPDGWEFPVLRSEFDSLLLGLAREAGAEVHFGRATSFSALPCTAS